MATPAWLDACGAPAGTPPSERVLAWAGDAEASGDEAKAQAEQEQEAEAGAEGQREQGYRKGEGRKFWGSVPLIGKANATRMVREAVRRETASQRRSTRDVEMDADGNMVYDEEEDEGAGEGDAGAAQGADEEAEHGFLSEADLDRIIERESRPALSAFFRVGAHRAVTVRAVCAMASLLYQRYVLYTPCLPCTLRPHLDGVLVPHRERAPRRSTTSLRGGA